MNPTTSSDEEDQDGGTTTITTTHSTRYDQRKSPPSSSCTSTVDETCASTTLYYWKEHDRRVFHPGRYKKLRKLAVLATTTKPPHESRYMNVSGITSTDDWLELVEHHALKLEQQQRAKEEKQRLKPPPKKKAKPPMTPPPPHPLTVLPGIQLRTHLHHQNEVQFEDGIDFSTPVEVIRHQKFLLQFLHYIVQKAKQPPPLLQHSALPASPVSPASPAESIRKEALHTDETVGTRSPQEDPDTVPATTNDSTIHFQNVLKQEHFASRISIHNPVAISHLVILEMHVPTLADVASLVQFITKAPLPIPRELPGEVLPSSNGMNHHNSNVVVLPTAWYHTNGTEPRSITEKLMYQSDGKHKNQSNSKNHKPFTQRDENRIGFIYNKLKPFVLSHQQWANENYPAFIPPPQPRHIPEESPLSAVVDDKIRTSWDNSPDGRFLPRHMSKEYSMMELNEARQFIKPYEVHSEDDTMTTTKDNTTKPVEEEPSLVPFVGHHHPGLMMMDRNNAIPQNSESILPEPYYDDEYKDTYPDTRRIFAVDCEMVETDMGKELARVTICEMISFDQVTKTESIEVYKAVLLDSVVQPYNRITNYLTQYSGISASTYDDADNRRIVAGGQNKYRLHRDAVLRLEQVQAILLQVIHPCDIVIGHSLENDLHALRFIHPTVVDTALMFQRQNTNNANHNTNDATGPISPSPSLPTRTYKHSLRHLAAVLLQREIQHPHRPHCSEEDARAAMDLAVRRATYGPSFCIHNTKGNSSNWFTKLSHQPENPVTAVAVGPVKWLRQHILSPSSSNATHALQCESIDDSNSKAIVRWVTGPARRASVVWSKMELMESSNNEMTRMKEWVHDVILKLSTNNSAVLMIPIQINLSGTKKLHQQRQIRRDNPRSTMPWSEADETQYQKSLEECRKGYVLYVTAKG